MNKVIEKGRTTKVPEIIENCVSKGQELLVSGKWRTAIQLRQILKIENSYF